MRFENDELNLYQLCIEFGQARLAGIIEYKHGVDHVGGLWNVSVARSSTGTQYGEEDADCGGCHWVAHAPASLG